MGEAMRRVKESKRIGEWPGTYWLELAAWEREVRRLWYTLAAITVAILATWRACE